MKKINLSNLIGLLSGTLLLGGCAVGGLGGGSDAGIDHLKIDLPQQIQWVQSQNKQMGKNGLLQEWVIKGFKSNNTPARIIYQKITPAIDTKTLMTKVLMPFKKSCADIKFSDIPLSSNYGDKLSNEMVCSKLGKNPVGLVAYTSVFTDKTTSHLIVGEVRTLPSKKAGSLDIKNEKQRKQAQTSAAVARLMHKMTTEIKVCDAKNKCE